jgi:isopenicillin N synthase-like dioxygenase
MLCYAQQPGLELRSRSGEWLSLPPAVDRIVVIVGDMLERLSSGYIIS